MSALELFVSDRRGSFALDVGVRLEARCTGLFGPSGAGKTSVLEALCGWRKLAHARIALDGEVLEDTQARLRRSAARRGIGYVPQDLLLFPHWSVRENLAAGAARRVGELEADLARAARVLELEGLLERKAGELSGGEARRVALGRALVARPRLLALDEPLGSLDASRRRRGLELLLAVREEYACRMIVVSHEAEELAVLCDEVLVLESGRVSARGAPGEVLGRGSAEGGEVVGCENVWTGVVREVARGTAGLELAGGARLEVPERGLKQGARAAVACRADEVLVATERPRGLSARNVLAAPLVELLPSGGQVIVRGRLGEQGPLIAAEITPAAVRELELASGREIYWIVKTRSLRVLAGW